MRGEKAKVDRFLGDLVSTFKKPTLNKVTLMDMHFNLRNSSTLLLAERVVTLDK